MGYFGDTQALRSSSSSLAQLATEFSRYAAALPADIPADAWSGLSASTWSAMLPLLRSHLDRVSTAMREASEELRSLATELDQLSDDYQRAAARPPHEYTLIGMGDGGSVLELTLAARSAQQRVASRLLDLAASVQLVVTSYSEPTGGADGMTANEKAILALNITGIADPTPLSDGTAAILSLKEGDLAGAGLSLLGIIPYVGDTAKAFKYGGKLVKGTDAVEHLAPIPGVVNKLAEGQALSKLDELAGYRRLPNSMITSNGYTYVTDNLGRTTQVSGRLKLDAAPRTSLTTEIGHLGLPGDHGGHLIGARFGGPSTPFNLVPQSANLNQSAYKNLENEWQRLLESGHRVDVSVLANYKTGGNTLRPNDFTIEYSVDGGEIIERPFKNR